MKKKISIAVIFGGISGEHEVSLQSALSVIAALDPKKYDIMPIRIEKTGRWMADPVALPQANTGKLIKGPRTLAPELSADRFLSKNGKQAEKIDVVLPLVHGTGGEDGCLPGLFELAGIPYVGSGVLGSALGMDKVVQKKILEREGLPVTPYLSYKKSEWSVRSKQIMSEVEKKLGFPNFVKPANLGSSVGISKAHHRRELRAAIDEAFSYDTKIIIEKAVPAAREIECGVIGNDVPEISVFGEIISSNEFYDYEAKYLSGKSKMLIPADISKALEKKMRDLALRTFTALEASGLARIDFLLSRETNEVFVNEINTIPGFTSHSMFAGLWKVSGLPFGKLLDKLVVLALDRATERRGLKRSFSTKKV